MRKLILLAVLAAGLATTACNTVKGAGQDVQAAGAAVSDTAEDAKPK
jgi:entericidin B